MRCLLSRPIAIGALVWCVSSSGCAFDTSGAAEAPPDPPDPVVDVDGAPSFPPGFDDPRLDAGDPPPEPTAFRLREVRLRDPHVFGFTFGGCLDFTDFGRDSINAQIAASVGGDDDRDGFLDRAMLLVFRPFAPDAEVTDVEVMNARCTAPVDDTTCSPLTAPVLTVARSLAAPQCDVPPAENLSGYAPPVAVASDPCFTTDAIEFPVNFGLELPSSDVVVSATFSDDGRELTGLLRGFITEEQAEAVQLARMLPGGSGACANHDARDVGPGGESGWYWYFNFVAERVELAAPTL